MSMAFSHRVRASGEVEIVRDGRVVTVLRGSAAASFLATVGRPGADAQRLMARMTGNYKRGNERTAARHKRNR